MNTTINPWGVIVADLEGANNGLGLRILWRICHSTNADFLWLIAADLDEFLLAEEVL